MPANPSALTHLSDIELVATAKRLAARESEAPAALVSCLAELDARRVYLGLGYSSLFAYAVQALGLSEDAAYFRIEAARAAHRFPVILELLARGAITLTGVRLLTPHLTEENHQALLDRAKGLSKRAIEEFVAELHPRPCEAGFSNRTCRRPCTSAGRPRLRSRRCPR